MTDPARTTLTPEEFTEALWRRYGHNPIDGESIWPGTIYVAATIRDAMAQSFMEGWLAGLEEAAGEVRRIEEEVEDGEDVVNLCDELERRIRALADVPKAPSE